MAIRIRKLILFITMLIILGCTNRFDWIASLPEPWILSTDEISEILPQFHSHHPDFHERLQAFALWQVGKPYALFKLGEEMDPDPDPIIRLDVSDCTVHVLTSLACAQSFSWTEARENMIRIHYKDHLPSYKSRWHYTSDRIQENPSTRDITPQLTSALEQVEIILNQKSDGREFLDLDWVKLMVVNYIPSAQVDESLLAKLPDICGVAFVKKAYFDMGIVIAHEGMIIDGQQLIHASAEFGKTVNVEFMDYYYKSDGPVFDGLMIYEFQPL